MANPPERIRLTNDNINQWPHFESLLSNDEIKFDRHGRLRYSHGAPVGDLVLIRINKDGTAKYQESADEWFDPESETARKFRWP